MATDSSGASDPFEQLRLHDELIAPRPEFAQALRARLERALGVVPTSLSNQGVAMSDVTSSLPKTSPGLGVVTPYLSVRGAAAALAFYAEVFGAVEEVERYVDETDGRIGHAQFRIGDSSLQIADEYPDFNAVGPETLGGTTVALSIYVHDVDPVYAKAVALGARGVRPPGDQFYGRSASILDPWGHRWTIQTVVEDRALPPVEGFDVVPPTAAAVPGVPEVAHADGPGERSARALELLHGPAQLGYFAMSTTDVATSSAFFSALLGWQVEPNGHIANIDPPGGIIPDESLSAPTLYFQIPDMDVAVAKVVELGGTVLSRTMYESGDNAECADVNGTRFDIYVPRPGYERQ